jgi:hypothetical protein
VVAGVRQRETPLTVQAFIADRSIGNGRLRGEPVGQMLRQVEELTTLLADTTSSTDKLLEARQEYREFIDMIAQRAFTKLLAWERELTYGRVNENIWRRYQAKVDRMLAAGAPEILDQFLATHRRLDDAARAGNTAAGEELSQAVATC